LVRLLLKFKVKLGRVGLNTKLGEFGFTRFFLPMGIAGGPRSVQKPKKIGLFVHNSPVLDLA
jgi:hypothetical protein